MLELLAKALYPVFGLVVLIGYAYLVRSGVEPFEADQERRVIAGATAGGHYRSPSVFVFGGLGGK